MNKKLLFLAMAFLGLAATGFSQSTPLYMGYYYTSDISIIDTATYTETSTISMTSDAGSVSGCYGLSLEPASGDMYILYQLDGVGAENRNLGIINLETGAIADIGSCGNLNDIGFVNDNLYGTTGSYTGQNFVSVDKTDGTTSLIISPSTDNEACGLIYNYFNGNVYFADEDHFSLIDIAEGTETLADAFPSFPEEVCSIVMLTQTTALVGNYDELYLFDLETYATSFIFDAANHIHGMAFGEYPLVVAIDGPQTFCSTEPSELSTTITGATYQWFLDGVLIDGATEATYDPTTSGAYSCEVDGELTKNEIIVEVIASPEVSFNATPNPVFLGDDPTGTVDFENTTDTGDSFLWDFDNGFTSTLENPSFPFVTAGEYDVVLTVTDSETGCFGSTTVTVIVANGVGLLEEQNNFSVYPVPTHDFVTISYE